MITPRISVAPRMLSKKRQASKRAAGDGPINESIGILDDTIAKVLSSDENDPETVVRIDERARERRFGIPLFQFSSTKFIEMLVGKNWNISTNYANRTRRNDKIRPRPIASAKNLIQI